MAKGISPGARLIYQLRFYIMHPPDDPDSELVIDGVSLPAKKQFLVRSFFPVGHLATSAMGIMPASTEVTFAELKQAREEVTGCLEQWGTWIISRVNWYSQALEALMADHGDDVQERTLEEHLAAFAMSIMVDERLAR